MRKRIWIIVFLLSLFTVPLVISPSLYSGGQKHKEDPQTIENGSNGEGGKIIEEQTKQEKAIKQEEAELKKKKQQEEAEKINQDIKEQEEKRKAQ